MSFIPLVHDAGFARRPCRDGDHMHTPVLYEKCSIVDGSYSSAVRFYVSVLQTHHKIVQCCAWMNWSSWVGLYSTFRCVWPWQPQNVRRGKTVEPEITQVGTNISPANLPRHWHKSEPEAQHDKMADNNVQRSILFFIFIFIFHRSITSLNGYSSLLRHSVIRSHTYQCSNCFRQQLDHLTGTNS